MRIIDSHVHTWTREIISDKDLEARRIAAKREGIKPQLDSPIENLRMAMQKAGIERAIVLPIDSGLNQEMPLTLTQKTDWHADEVSGDANIAASVGLDPRRGDEGLVELERAVREKGCCGWKMYPPNGFYPDELEFYPYYELCTKLGVPVTIHSGFTSRFKHMKYAQPVYIDKVAADFPGLKIVIAHAGAPWVDEALAVAAKNPNVSIDVSGWQAFASRVPIKVYRMIGDAKLMKVFPNRMLWGSDFPFYEHFMPIEKWTEFFLKLKLPKSLLDVGYPPITEDEIDSMMWKNAARLFFGENP